MLNLCLITVGRVTLSILHITLLFIHSSTFFFSQEDDSTDSHLALICLNIFRFLFLYFFSRTGVSSFTFSLLLVMAASAEMHFTQPNCILFLFLPISTVFQVLLKFLKLVSKAFAVFPCLLSSDSLINIFSDSSSVSLMKIFIKVQESPQRT